MSTKYYVVSDVHGFYSNMVHSLKLAGYYEDTSPHKLIICGDVMDRGTEAKEMQEFVLDLLKKDEVILIRGNHEDLFEELASKDKGILYSHHEHNGTWQTGIQLTGMSPNVAFAYNDLFAAHLRQTPFYKEIMPKMVPYYETEHYIFVHGWIPTATRKGEHKYTPTWRTMSPAKWREARWVNGMKFACEYGIKEPGKTIVCGHWHASYGHSKFEGKGEEFGFSADFSPFYADGIIAIDGCTAYSGIVNCIVLDD